MSDSTLDIGRSEPATGPDGSAVPSRGQPEAATAGDAASEPQPTATFRDLALTPPAPVSIVPAEQATRAVTLDEATLTKLEAMVAGYLDAVTSLDPMAPAFASRANDIRTLGDDDLRASAAVSNRLINRPGAALERAGGAEGAAVYQSLISLRRTVEDLDPGRQGNLLAPRKVLGVVPFGNRIRDYFTKYRSGQSHLNAIINALNSGQAELVKDNAAVEQEKANLSQVMERLRQYVYLAERLDAGLSTRVHELEPSDPDKARVLQEDLLFYIRQKVQDLLTQLAVSVQGFMALDVIRRNNEELIKGVDRATTTTVSALRTAVVVAQALADQKLVLDQITALNSTTSSLIESTSAMLRQQSGQINEQAASATVQLSSLQTAFDNIYRTIDEIDAFRLKSLDSMSQTIEALAGQIARSQAQVDRIEAAGTPEDRTAPSG